MSTALALTPAHNRAHENRRSLVTRFLPLARKLARRYQYYGETYEDLVQVASLGLMKAADRYDDTIGAAFPTYAWHTMLGELKRHLRDNCWALHVPRDVKERALRVNLVLKAEAERGATPSTRDLAARLQLDEQHVVEALQAFGVINPLSLDAPTSWTEDPDGPALMDAIGADDDGYELVNHRLALRAALRDLTPREREILFMSFIEGCRQIDIAARLSVSQAQISREFTRALKRLRLNVASSDARATARSASTLGRY